MLKISERYHAMRYHIQTYLSLPVLVENTMISCRSTRGAVTASATDAYAGPPARMCEIMRFDRGDFRLMSQDARTAAISKRRRWGKKMISASARSRRMMIKVLKSPTPTSHGEVPSISRPAYRNMPNEVGLDQTTPSFTQRYTLAVKYSRI